MSGVNQISLENQTWNIIFNTKIVELLYQKALGKEESWVMLRTRGIDFSFKYTYVWWVAIKMF